MKKILQQIFSIKNEIKNNRKYKIIRVLGIKLRFRNKNYCPVFETCAKSGISANFSEKYNTVHYLVSMLKAYGLKYAVGSPGTKNSNLNFLLQEQNSIKCFSVVDERSAAYTANGICQESNEPCVITSTGATASRNFIPAMTEAYYKKNPVIAITGYAYSDTKYSIIQQFVDRSITQNDIKYISVELPRIVDEADKRKCIMLLNVALTNAFHRHLPVHINCPMYLDFDIEKAKNLPKDIWVSDYYSEDFENIKKELKNKRIAIFLGSHIKFSKKELALIEKFAKIYNAPVWCDCSSNYYGVNKLLSGQVFGLTDIKTRPDVVIDIGNVSAEYYALNALRNTQVWRVTNLDEIGYRFNIPSAKIFDCKESYFFELMTTDVEENKCNYYQEIYEQTKSIKMPDLPLCNAYVCSLLAKYIPNNSSLHLGILNSLRCMEFFNLDSSIRLSCNNGGYGIDGAISAMAGQSFVSSRGGVYGIVGDLAFFYDMNIIGNRHVKNNFRLIVVNNNRGEEMRLNPALENYLSEKSDILISAGGHYKNGCRGWIESCGFEYMSAKTKKEYDAQIENFCKGYHSKPVIFEVFTTDEDEKEGLKIMRKYNR